MSEIKWPTLAEVEKVHILMVFKDLKHNRTHTAKVLGIGIRTLQRKLKAWGMGDLVRIR